MSRITDQEQEEQLEMLEKEYLYGQDDLNISLPNQIKSEELYNANKEYNDYMKNLEDNAELFTQEEFDKLKTEEGYAVYLNLTQEQKEQLFPLSYNDDLINEYEVDDDDIFIGDEEDTRII